VAGPGRPSWALAEDSQAQDPRCPWVAQPWLVTAIWTWTFYYILWTLWYSSLESPSCLSSQSCFLCKYQRSLAEETLKHMHLATFHPFFRWYFLEHWILVFFPPSLLSTAKLSQVQPMQLLSHLRGTSSWCAPALLMGSFTCPLPDDWFCFLLTSLSVSLASLASPPHFGRFIPGSYIYLHIWCHLMDFLIITMRLMLLNPQWALTSPGILWTAVLTE
jgi:hypothetical protein